MVVFSSSYAPAEIALSNKEHGNWQFNFKNLSHANRNDTPLALMTTVWYDP